MGARRSQRMSRDGQGPRRAWTCSLHGGLQWRRAHCCWGWIRQRAARPQSHRRAGARAHRGTRPTLDASSSQRLPLVGGSHSGGSHPPRHPLLRAHVGVPAVSMMSDYGCPLNIITALVPATAQSHVLAFLASLCPLNCLHAPLSCIHGVGDEAFRGGWRTP